MLTEKRGNQVSPANFSWPFMNCTLKVYIRVVEGVKMKKKNALINMVHK